MKDYMSGDELYRFLHISKRKMKYLLENGYIPMTDTGMKTHRYRIRRADVLAFKQRMDTEQGFLAELNGMFSNRSEWHPVPLLEVTDENRAAFHAWLTEQWNELPEAMQVKDIVQLIGGKPMLIHSLIEKGTLHGVTVSGKVYCPKSEVIDFAASAEKLSNPSSQIFRELIRTFKKHQSRKREKEKRRCKRKDARND